MQKEQYEKIKTQVEKNIREHAIPWLKKFINIPNTSRNFDLEFSTNGLIQQACNLNIEYAEYMKVAGLEVKLYQDPGKTPVVFGTIAATKQTGVKDIMVYGHIDKQPHQTEQWREGLHPFKAVEENGLLYGRGGVDDGYNFFTVVAIIKSLQELNIPHDRYVLFYETDEESASIDIPYYLEKFKDVIKQPNAMFCLDACTISKDIFSITTTLRGCCNFDLKVKVLEKSMHSGVGTGIVPSTFRILRHLLDRIECPKTGKIIDQLQVEIPHDKMDQAVHCSKIQGEGVFNSFCLCQGVKPVSDNVEELYLNNIWRSQLEIIGQKGIPDLETCGNVLRNETTFRCSLRLPPTLEGDKAFKTIHDLLTKDPPYGAKVEVTLANTGTGWSSNEFPNKVMEILDRHNQEIFGTKTLMYGCGGSIPFIKTLQDNLPNTLLFVSGVVLPDSMMHGPNERIDLEYLIKFSKSLTCFLVDYCELPETK
jgi:acetylornithine deacetylase/succinyl-diaminopimelate desuccinylase-like protein